MTLLEFANPQVRFTVNNTPYLTECGIAVLSRPLVDLRSVHGFLSGFVERKDHNSHTPIFNPGEYIKDTDPVDVTGSGGDLAKFAGQLCYLSFGEARSKRKDKQKYFDNIKKQRHGSVMEHAHFALLFFGIDRGVTHEIVRHRTGVGFSQVSQRYVNGSILRFVMRPEYQSNDMLRETFFASIDVASVEYDKRAELLRSVIITEGMSKTEARKAVNQAARATLPNETEAPIVVSGNVRAWRHFIEQRASIHADLPIRLLAFKVCKLFKLMEPELFSDYVIDETTHSVTTEHVKV